MRGERGVCPCEEGEEEEEEEEEEKEGGGRSVEV